MASGSGLQHHYRAVFISMLGVCCKLLINTWRKTLPLLSDAAATAQGLLFDPAGFSPWWAISHFPLALELFILFHKRNLGRKVPVLLSLFFCPWPRVLFLLCFALSKAIDELS